MKELTVKPADNFDTTSSAEQTGPARSCIVCRAVKTKSALVRLSLVGENLVVSGLGVSRGRGVYICLSRACLLKVSAHKISQALGLNVSFGEVGPWLEQINTLAERRGLEIIGLARRQGMLVCGCENIEKMTGGVVLMANDLAQRSKNSFRGHAFGFVDGQRLGHAAGMGWVGGMRITAGRLALQAAYWLSLWYESRPSEILPTAEGFEIQKVTNGPLENRDRCEVG